MTVMDRITAYSALLMDICINIKSGFASITVREHDANGCAARHISHLYCGIIAVPLLLQPLLLLYTRSLLVLIPCCMLAWPYTHIKIPFLNICPPLFSHKLSPSGPSQKPMAITTRADICTVHASTDMPILVTDQGIPFCSVSCPGADPPATAISLSACADADRGSS